MHTVAALTTLALSALAAAIPAPGAAGPAKFAIQITAKISGQQPTALYLAKGASGAGTPDLKSAATCTITDAKQLSCDGKTIGASPIDLGDMKGYVDMAPIAPPAGANAITDGFSVDGDSLHWRSSKFASLPKVGEVIMKDQGGEAKWGLMKNLDGSGQIMLYAQLGCPGGTHSGKHTELIVGSNKILPI